MSVDYLLGRTESKPETVFYKRYQQLCAQKGVSVSVPPAEIGMSNAAQTDWKNGAVPRLSSIKKLADYFGVPIAYFTGDAPAEMPQEDAELLRMYHALSADGMAKMKEKSQNAPECFLTRRKRYPTSITLHCLNRPYTLL